MFGYALTMHSSNRKNIRVRDSPILQNADKRNSQIQGDDNSATLASDQASIEEE